MGEEVRIGSVIKFAGAYIALEIGSGFATGQEILQFYSSYGVMSIPAALISMIIFAWAGSRIMAAGFILRDSGGVRPYRLFCGKKPGIVYEWFVLLYLFAGLSVMISGAGASIKEYYGVNYYVGGVMMALLVFAAFAFGRKRLIDAVGLLGPLIIGVTIYVAICVVLRNGEFQPSDAVLHGASEKLRPAPFWWMSGILYAAYNLVSSLPFLMALGGEAHSAKEASAGGIAGGIVLMLTAVLMNIALLAAGDEVQGSVVPTLKMAMELSPLTAEIFTLILLCGIFSTAAPMLWTICKSLAGEGSRSSRILALLLCLDALVLGQLPFDRLVAAIYPVSGYMGLFLLLCIGRCNGKQSAAGVCGRRKTGRRRCQTARDRQDR